MISLQHSSGICASLALVTLVPGVAEGREEQLRWRLFDAPEQALFAITDTAEATDHLGLPIIRCTPKSGHVIVEGEAKANLRAAMAKVMVADETPALQVLPAAKDEANALDLFFSYVDGWRYKFDLQVGHKAVERFMRDGVIEFKLGDVQVREEFKPGLASAARFFDICKASSK